MNNLYHFSLYEKKSGCCLKQARLLAIVSKFGGRVDSSVLWLSFAQQKYIGLTMQMAKNTFFVCSILGQVASRRGVGGGAVQVRE
jgi:hypothetical protein